MIHQIHFKAFIVWPYKKKQSSIGGNRHLYKCAQISAYKTVFNMFNTDRWGWFPEQRWNHETKTKPEVNSYIRQKKSLYGSGLFNWWPVGQNLPFLDLNMALWGFWNMKNVQTNEWAHQPLSHLKKLFTYIFFHIYKWKGQNWGC